MIRITALIVATAALVPLGPLGCPPTDTTTDDAASLDRGTLATTARAPESAVVGATVELEAAVIGNDGGSVYYAWLQTDGPGVAIERARHTTASFTAPSLATAKSLGFMVTTANDAGDVGRAAVSVLVEADPYYGQRTGSGGPPIANAGPDQTVAQGSQVVLDGSDSSGLSLTYRWRRISGAVVGLIDADAMKATFVAPAYDVDGTNKLLFELTVRDTEDRAMTDRTQVSIKNPYISDTQVIIDTTLGSITVELDPDKAPLTVANFLQYVDDGFYDGTLFHRVIAEFVIQGGGYLPDMVEKETRDPIKNEADNGLSNLRGTIAMARLSAPDSATSQFFVNLVDNTADGDGMSDLDPGGVSPDGYAVFGKVIKGMDVVDAIAAVETDSNDAPVEDVIINSIKRVDNTPQSGGGSGTTTGDDGGTTTNEGDTTKQDTETR